MKTVLLIGTAALVIVWQAGWLSSEDHPLQSPSSERTAFVRAGIEACMAHPQAFVAASYLTPTQKLYLCNCRTRELADGITQKELDLLKTSPTLLPETKVAAANDQCFEEMMLEEHK